jgi:hypothetical protein
VNVMEAFERLIQDARIVLPLVYGSRLAIDAEQAVDGIRRAAHRVFDSEDNIVGLLAELASEGEVLPSHRQHIRPVSSFSAQELAGDEWHHARDGGRFTVQVEACAAVPDCAKRTMISWLRDQGFNIKDARASRDPDSR